MNTSFIIENQAPLEENNFLVCGTMKSKNIVMKIVVFYWQVYNKERHFKT